jgi:hypothetical protein
MSYIGGLSSQSEVLAMPKWHPNKVFLKDVVSGSAQVILSAQNRPALAVPESPRPLR